MKQHYLTDKKLSWNAKGILTFLLNKKVSTEVLLNSSTNGTHSVFASLKELELRGYLIRKKLKNEKGQFIGFDSECKTEIEI